MNEAIYIKLTNRFAHFLSWYPEEVHKFFSYVAPGYYWSPAYKRRQWDGRIHMIRYNKMSAGLFIRLRREAEQKLGISFEVNDRRHRPRFQDIGLESKRDYQNECVKMMEKASRTGGIVLNATGSGKTFIAGLYFGRLDGCGVFIVDELTLLEQTQEELARVMHEKVGKIGDQVFAPERITVATIQTLHRHSRDKEFDRWRKTLDVAIVDELHLALNKRNLTTLTSIPFKAIFGLTATLKLSQKPVRMKAYALCGPVIFEYPLKQGVFEDRLAPGVVIGSDIVKVETDKERKMKYVDAYSRIVVEGKRWNRRIVDLTEEAILRGHPVIVLVQRVSHVKRVYERLRKLKIRVKPVYGAKSTDQRRKYIRLLEHGKLDVLVVNKVFQKGISINCVSVMIDGTAARDPDSALQKYGRGVRKHKDKIGLLYFHLGYIGTRFQNAGKVHRRAYRKAGLVVKTPKWHSARYMFDYAELELKKVLYKLRRQRRKARKKHH